MKQSQAAELRRKEPLTAKQAQNVIEFTGVSGRTEHGAQAPNSAKLPPRKPKNLDRRIREYLTVAEVKAMRDAAKKSGRYGFRDAAMILFAYRHAFRVSELVNLRWEQIDFDAGKLFVRRLKKGDPSVHYLEGDQLRILRQLKRENPGSPFVFLTERLGPMSPRAFNDIISRAGKVAGLSFPVHAHMLRHAKGYQLANAGNDIRLIQSFFGHRQISHTALYTKIDATRFAGLGRDGL